MNVKKNVARVALGMLVVCLMSGVAMGNAQYAGNWFLWDQWDSAHNTVNDWVKVGSPGYEAYFNLTSTTTNPNNGAAYSQGNTNVSLVIEAVATPNPVTVPAGTWAGYEFTVPLQYPEQKVNWAWLAGYFCFLTGSMEIQVTDVNGVVMWSSSPVAGWLGGGSGITTALTGSSRTVRVIVKATQTHNLWGSGNFVYFSPFHLKTVGGGQVVPICGDPDHQPPIGDFTEDCIVNFADFAVMASHWLEDSMLPPPPQPHLSQFGYYIVSVDPYPNYISQVNGKTNFNHMDWSVARAQAASACTPPQKMVVNLRWHLFDGENNLRTDYISSWNLLSSQMAPYIDTIGAFYVMDEPYWNGISKADLEMAAALIKSTFPDTPTMVVEAYPAITGTEGMPPFQMPSYIDYYGVDQYGDFTAIPALLAIVKSQQLPGQQLFLVPQNIAFGSTDAQVASWAYDYYNLALSDETMVALMVFLWPDLTVDPIAPVAGLELAGPMTLAAFDDIGGQILSGAKPKIFFPASYTVNQGTYSSGNAASVKNYDASYLVVNSAANLATTDFSVTGVSIAAPSKIKVRVNTKSSVASTTQAIQLWNYSTSAWDSKDSTTIGTGVAVRDITVTTGAANYISGGILKVRVAGSKTSAFTLSQEQIAVLAYN